MGLTHSSAFLLLFSHILIFLIIYDKISTIIKVMQRIVWSCFFCGMRGHFHVPVSFWILVNRQSGQYVILCVASAAPFLLQKNENAGNSFSYYLRERSRNTDIIIKGAPNEQLDK